MRCAPVHMQVGARVGGPEARVVMWSVSWSQRIVTRRSARADDVPAAEDASALIAARA